MAELVLENVSKRYGGASALSDVSLRVAEGEFLVLVGPSGCGKSTLLRIVAGLVEASAGEVRMDGRRVDGLEPSARDVALVFQNYALYPHMSGRGNLSFPLRMAGVGRREIEARVARTAEVLGLGDLLERKPATLSGGQMQRVALGRAIIRNPRLFLFDEPLSNLDAKLRTEMRAEIGRLHERLRITTLYVTHDQAEALTMGSQVCVLDRGRVQQVGTPREVYQRPANAFVAAFLGSPGMNLVRGEVRGGRFHAGPLVLPAPAALEGRAVRLGVRPHEVVPGPDLALDVTYVEELGSQTLIECALGPERFLVSRPGHVDVPRGQPLSVTLPPERLHWFDAESGDRLEV